MLKSFWIVPLFASTLCSAQIIWTGHTSNATIVWSSKNIRALNTGSKQEILDLSSSLNAAFQAQNKTIGDHLVKAEHDVSIESVVGNILSIRDASDIEFGGPHDDRRTQFSAFNLAGSKPGKPIPAQLTDLFPEQAILKALQGDKRIQDAVGGNNQATNLKQLLAALDKQSIKNEGCEFAVRSDFLASFAVYDYADGVATIRLGLPNYLEICLGDLLEIDIKLEVPAALRAAFDSAASRKQGFLMKDRARIASEDSSTALTFSQKHSTQAH